MPTMMDRLRAIFIVVVVIIIVIHVFSAEGGKYDYGLFENFEVTRRIFVDEQKLFQNLKSVRGELTRQRQMMMMLTTRGKTRLGPEEGHHDQTTPDDDNNNNTQSSGRGHILANFLMEGRDLVGKSRSVVDQLRESVSVHEKEFPPPVLPKSNNTNSAAAAASAVSDYEGAMKGMVVLLNTYNLDVAAFADGVISDKGLQLKSDHSLTVEDLVNLAVTAFKNKWYNTAVKLMRVAIVRLDPDRDFHDTFDRAHFDYVAMGIRETNNQHLLQKKRIWHLDYTLYPFLVDETLARKKRQPKFLKAARQYKRDPKNQEEVISGELQDEADRKVCRGDLVGDRVIKEYSSPPNNKCHFLHHDDPFLNLGPFKMEILLKNPFRMIFHDFLSESEIKYMIDYSTPRLSRARVEDVKNQGEAKKRFSAGNKVRIVSKTVQCWIIDKFWKEPYTINMETKQIGTMKDPDSYQVNHLVMFKLAKKIEIATRLNVSARFASTEFQVTNYGLSGLCESHIDPHGYIEGREVPEERKNLYASGDMIATFMSWLGDVDAGGYTAFDSIGYEQAVQPTKGSAVFWIDLDRKGHKERRSAHSGCPVLKGSKWILNKWIYYFDQFKMWPCGRDPKEEYPPFDRYY